MPPTIDFSTSIKIPSELRSDFIDVFQRMYPDSQRVVIEKQFSAHSFSGGWVFQIEPIKSDGRVLPIIIKIGAVSLIEREFQAYTTYIKGQWAATPELREPPIPASPGGLSGLAYTLEGYGIFSVQTLLEYCQARNVTAENVQNVTTRLEIILSECILRNRKSEPKFSWQPSYEGLLPMNCWVTPFPPDFSFPQTPFSISPDRLPTHPLAPQSYVCLEDFAVTKVDLQKYTITLNVPAISWAASGSRRAYSIRLHYANRNAMPIYQIGEIIPRLEGLIGKTRESQWQTEMDDLNLVPPFDLSQESIQLENGTQLPNPFLAVPTILNQFRDGWVTNIHGDFNLGNVLVVPKVQDVRFIDFADARQDHVLHDLLRLETEIVTQLVSPVLANNQRPAQTVHDLYALLHPYLTTDSEKESAVKLPHPDLEKSWILLSMIRRTAREYGLFKRSEWNEYYEGLTLYLLGSLKFRNLNSEAKEVVFWGAAAAQELMDKDVLSPELPDEDERPSGKKGFRLILLMTACLGILLIGLYLLYTYSPFRPETENPTTATLIHSAVANPTPTDITLTEPPTDSVNMTLPSTSIPTHMPETTTPSEYSPIEIFFESCSEFNHTFNTTELVSLAPNEITRIGHGRTNDLQISPDGRYLALASGVGVWLYTLDESCTRQLLLEDLPGVSSIAWSADGTALATNGYDRRLRIWLVESDRFVQREEFEIPADIDGGNIYSADWSPDGKYVAYITESSGIVVWNVKTDELEMPLEQSSSPRQQLAWSPDSSKLAFIYESGTNESKEKVNQVNIWNVNSWEKQSLEPINGYKPRLEWSPNNKQIAYGYGQEIYIWDLEQKRIVDTLPDNDNYILRGLAWHPNGKHLATIGDRGNIQFWDIETGDNSHQIEGHFRVLPSVWSPNGKQIATGWVDGSLTVWDPSKGEIVDSVSHRVNSVLGIVWEPNSDRLATLHWDGLTRLWNLKAANSPRQIDKIDKPNIDHNYAPIVAWSRPKGDDQFIASGAEDGRIYTWQVDQWDQVCILDDGNDAPVRSVSWSPDQQLRLASAEAEGQIHIWDTAACGNEGENRITEPVQTLEGHTSDTRVISVLWSSTYPKKLVSGSSDGHVLLWSQQDDATWSFEKLRDKRDGEIRYLAWSSDDKQLAVDVSHRIEIWDMETRLQRGVLDGHNDRIYTLSWSPDNQKLVSSSHDGTVRIWDVTELKE